MKTKKQEIKSPVGRPSAHSKGLPIYESIRQASGSTGVPVAIWRDAKRRGCPAFKSGNRIDLGLFLLWHFTNSGDKPALDLNHERALLAQQQRIALEFENAERRGELFNRDAVEEIFWISGLAEMRQMYFAALKTYRQHPEPFVAVQIVTETLPKILRIFNEVFQTKKAEIEAQDAATVETKSEP